MWICNPNIHVHALQIMWTRFVSFACSFGVCHYIYKIHLLLGVKSDCVQQDNASYDLGFTHYIHEYKTPLNILHIIHEYNNTQYFIVISQRQVPYSHWSS